MKQNFRKAVALLALLCMLIAFVPAKANAAQDAESQRWNIMLVIDGSDSLNYKPNSGRTRPGTDPEGLRFEAIESFIDTLHDSGHYVGAIVFTGNMSKDTSDAAMLTGIKLDTWENGPVALEGNRGNLKSQIRNCDTTNSMRQYKAETDVGTALLLAEQRCEEATAANGLPSAIFLFTDGKLACNEEVVTVKARQNFNTAAQRIYDNGIVLCGVFLNVAENEDERIAGVEAAEEFRDIVATANGISSSAPSLPNYFIEINSASDCYAAIDRFFLLLGYSLDLDGEFDIIYETTEYSFQIPGIVDEMNFRVKTLDGTSLPAGTAVYITQPDGTSINTDRIVRSSVRDSYRIYKITDPMAGKWTVRVELPEGNTVGVQLKSIKSAVADVDFETSIPEQNLHANLTTDVTAFLIINGSRVTETKSYDGFDCKLTLTNFDTKDVYEFPITRNSADQFVVSVPLNFYGKYEASVSFYCGEDFIYSSPAGSRIWDLSNHAPDAAAADISMRSGLFQQASAELDIADKVSDVEDPASALVIEIIGADKCDAGAVAVNGTVLTFDTAKIGDGTLYYRVTDSQGASAESYITVKNTNTTFITIIIIAVIFAALLIILWIALLNRPTPKGELSLQFAVQTGGEGGFGTSQPISASFAPPGKNGRRKTTLYKLIANDMSSNYGAIPTAFSQQGLDINIMNTLMSSEAKTLKRTKLSCVSKRVAKKKTAAVKVSAGKSTVLYNSTMVVNVGGTQMTIGYFVDSDGNNWGPNSDWAVNPAGVSDNGGWGTASSDNGGWGAAPANNGWGSTPAAPADNGWGSTPAAPTDNGGWGGTPAAPADNGGWGAAPTDNSGWGTAPADNGGWGSASSNDSSFDI